MSTNDQKLISDHKEVVEALRLFDKINLINTSGEPIDEYDLEYKVKGYSFGADRRIKVRTGHRIQIKLPFGYPHFHPTVKPLSPIFHPDIDDYAIRIAHHWERNKSLPDLILHIGDMICGKEFTTDNPFNKKAAEYYIKHQKNLPLDSLKQPRKEQEKEKRREKESSFLDFFGPFLKIIAFLVVVGLVGCGILFFFEKAKIDEVTLVFQKAQDYAQGQEYNIAKKTAEKALADLGDYILLQSAGKSLRTEIDSFIQSESMREGLRGRIKFGDKYLDIKTVHKLELLQQFQKQAREYAAQGDAKKASEKYDEALQYAEKNGLQDTTDEVKEDLAGLKLSVLVAASEKAHESKKWDWAIAQHEKVIEYIKEEQAFLKNVDRQLTKTNYLLLIDRIALYSRLASAAENDNDIENALKNYNALITHIGKSNAKDNTTLKKTLVDALQKVALLTEKLNIKQNREWLLVNYKEIFQIHYPTAMAATLRNPQALFVKYNGKNPIYDLSCLDKSQGSVVRLRIYYQYNPDTGQWSTYDGEI